MARTKTNPLEINREVRYTEEEEERFIEVANEIGIGPAMRELGYPGSYNTCAKWFKSRSLETPTVTSLQAHASSLKQHYALEEEMAGVQLLMDRYVEKALTEEMTPDELNKLANGYERLMKTKRLIEGKSTNIAETQTYDGTDLEIMKLAQEMEERNARSISEYSGANGE